MKMKKSLLIIVLLSFGFIYLKAQSQAGLRAGLKGSYNSTWLITQDIADATDTTYIPSFGHTFGLGIGYNFVPSFGVNIDVLLNTHNQNYGSDGTGTDWSIYKKLKLINVNFLLKYVTQMGFYLEGGAQYNSFKSATEDRRQYFSNLKYYDFDYKDRDISANFESGTLSWVFGFGGEWYFTDNLFLLSGLRFKYSLSEMVSETGKKNDSIFKTNGTSVTNAASGGLMLGLYYWFG
ncbi:MAG: hypothetical protein COC01_10690 [Bacteroidetes bacterium]|nr:outer membrane beta-barrel protein [Sphingobacteriaceae bacterium AH-315-L07]PCH64714.1 MAG: hypothetical protein COC01_10690 [Bacteroidota bacterium]